MIALTLAGCIDTIRFPPDLWSWDTATRDTGWWAWDTGKFQTETETTTGGTGDDDDDAPSPGLLVWNVEAGCDPDATAWQWNAWTNGWVGSARLNLFRTDSAQSEEHTMRLVGSDPEGTWDELQTGPLPDQTPPVDQVADLNSRFDCARPELLTTIVRVWDPANVLQDCVVWGADPEGAVAAIRTIDPAVSALGGCRPLEP
ncbi:MAG: hypothetical protein ABMB14_34810 [Myxococcota bacterium]